jgi:hypothetical protein
MSWGASVRMPDEQLWTGKMILGSIVCVERLERMEPSSQLWVKEQWM